MNAVTNLFSRYWHKTHFVIMAVLVAALAYQGSGLSNLAAETCLRTFYYPFFRMKAAVIDLVGVRVQNQQLRESLVDLSVRATMLEESGRENIRLRSVLGFEPPTGYSLVPAKVMAVSGEKLPVSAVINRGEKDGLAVNEPIINEEGLIGKIVSVSHSFATVQLLTDPANRVAVRVAESREMGIVKFALPQGMIVDNVPSQGDVKEGDLILSSGLGGIYPAGLVVGTVIAVERSKQEPFLKVRLAPAPDFNSLDELFVLRA